jgi:hypothetical protein
MEQKLLHDNLDYKSRDFMKDQVAMYFETKNISGKAKCKVNNFWKEDPWESYNIN